MAQILIVDDDAAFLAWEECVLRGLGHVVRTATSGTEALRLVETWAPDLVLLDILMPDLDGYVVHDRIRARRPIPVVYVSVLRGTGESVLRGATAHVAKPLTPERLLAVVRESLGPITGRTILVVDDDPHICDFYQRVIGDEGQNTVQTAENGQAALDHLARGGIDLVITDVHMPLMDGLELVRTLRRDARWSGLPVIVQTNDDLIARSNVWVELGVEQVMEKGRFAEWLTATVARRLGDSLSNAT